MPRARLLVSLPVDYSGPIGFVPRLQAMLPSLDTASPTQTHGLTVPEAFGSLVNALRSSDWKIDEMFLGAKSADTPPEVVRIVALGEFSSFEEAHEAAIAVGAGEIPQDPPRQLSILDFDVSANGARWEKRVRMSDEPAG